MCNHNFTTCIISFSFQVRKSIQCKTIKILPRFNLIITHVYRYLNLIFGHVCVCLRKVSVWERWKTDKARRKKPSINVILTHYHEDTVSWFLSQLTLQHWSHLSITNWNIPWCASSIDIWHSRLKVLDFIYV